ncbi:S41 family peptidase [Desulfurivibrio alkaliphilus]|uniref:Carboxyl-terminal protease n=1 Tax=Desulfurivibrio alkaliphilus (strain DSM 19089 / UNIQEM U267 / AHT2) TaxID=589865 RepID=D6Z2X1_DESAT|nr:S41 family peptidase [Desulfurivibrio alkaliphilus]ADH85896.1 carboxyl-terminal protease [Desulfurivibrio alkaliphilus AHT 2]
MKITRKLLTRLALPGLGAVFFLLLAFYHLPDGQAAKSQDTYRHLETFTNVLHIIQQSYVDEVDPEEAIEGAIRGMLQSLDPHSSYLRADDFKDLQMETKGAFTGIGIEISMRDGMLTVVAPIEGTPADKAGLRAADRIVGIDGETTKGISLMEAVRKLRGPEGTEVTVTIHRDGWSEFRDITIVRGVIPIYSVKSELLEPGYAHIRISNFQAKTTKDFREALNNFQKQEELKGVILDLRNNPGGLLDQAVQLADVFLDEGVIVSTKGRIREQNMVFEARKTSGRDRYRFPLVVLVNEGSASASEIVAGALQDHQRAVILGTPTFGKGSVQTIIPLNDGAGLRLTTARYYTPSGISIQAKGITPDIEVHNEPPNNATTAAAEKDQPPPHMTFRERDLLHHLDSDRRQPKTPEAEEKKDDKDKELREKLARDRQLQTALTLLKGLQVFNQRGTP